MNQQELTGWLRDQTGRHRDPDLSGAVAELAEPFRIARILEEMVDDHRWLGDVAASSYMHPNGFWKLVLASSCSAKLRLHVWECERHATATENIHSHAWDFSSVILVGGYRYQEFHRSDDGTNLYRYRYVKDEEGDSYQLVEDGTVPMTCVFDARFAAPTSYTLKAESLHRVIGEPGRLTVSLVLQGPRRLADVHVLVGHEHDEGEASLRRPSPDALRTKIADLIPLVGREPLEVGTP